MIARYYTINGEPVRASPEIFEAAHRFAALEDAVAADRVRREAFGVGPEMALMLVILVGFIMLLFSSCGPPPPPTEPPITLRCPDEINGWLLCFQGERHVCRNGIIVAPDCNDQRTCACRSPACGTSRRVPCP